MNPKNTFLLVLLAAALFAFIYLYERHLNFDPPPPPKLLSGFQPKEVNSVQVQFRGQEAIRADRTNGNWQLTRPLNYPAQSLAVEGLLKILAGLTAQTHISAEELKTNRNVNADYGFESPYATLIIQQGEARWQLTLGSLTAPSNQVYAQVIGSEGVDIISIDIFQYIPRVASDWRDTRFVNLNDQTFDRLTITNGLKSFEIRRDTTNTLWHMSTRERVDVPKVNNLLDRLQTLRIVEFKTDNPKADLETFGLQPPELELDFDLGTNHQLLLQFGKSPTNQPDLVYARRDGQSTIVLVPAKQVAGWRAEKVDFRDRTLAGMYNGPPDEIDVLGRNHFVVQRQTNDAWRVISPDNFAADTNLMRSFIERLALMQVVATNGQLAVKDIVPPSELTNYGLAAPAPMMKIILKQHNTNASGSNSIMAELDFGAVTNDIIYARRPEEPSVYAVALMNFQKLPSSGFQLRDRRIWDFTEDDVTRIIIRQDGKPMELVHKGPNDWSLAVGSQGIMNNSLTVEVGAQELGVLAAEDFVEHGDQNRAAYGFNDKSLQIAVDIKKGGKPATLKVDFGGWSPRQLRYGLVELDGEKWIFELPSVVYDRLTSYFNIRENAGP